MRARLTSKQIVTIRPISNQIGDAFGDAPIVVSTTRQSGFAIPMQVTWTNTTLGDPGTPGRERRFTAVGRILVREIPPDAPNGWEPAQNDMVELVTGRQLFVVASRPAFPKKPRLGVPSGKWDGWELSLGDRDPAMRGAGQY